MDHLNQDTYMPFRFEELKIWREALRLSNEIDALARTFPRVELYSLTLQVKRAADSVVLNIAEGSTGQSKPEFRRFLGIALRSALEVVSCLFISRARKYIQEDAFETYYKDYELLCKMITKLRDSI